MLVNFTNKPSSENSKHSRIVQNPEFTHGDSDIGETVISYNEDEPVCMPEYMEGPDRKSDDH